jgi:hypothetical protein
MDTNANNTVSFDVTLDGDAVTVIRYIGTEGNVLSSLDAADYVDAETDGVVNYALSEEFLSGLEKGTSGLQFEFASGTTLRVALEAVDSTLLAAAVAEGAAITPTETPEYEALATEINTATATLNTVNRTVTGTGNTGVTTEQVDAAASSLRSALDAYAATPGASSALGDEG